MSPSDRDAQVPEGWRKMLHLPQFLVCPDCGSVCDAESAELHKLWHGRLEQQGETANG